MATIKAIEAQTIHQIQSGQVIVDLCSVVKELVENSLDAGATSIDVRFKNQGLDAIEVQDNGSGISPNNYETLALKHYTSKLATYSDLTTLETFGFRGEALSSLCALSTFTVTTCLAADVPKGSKLEFETSGKLRSTTVVASQKGTTISVENLFKNLPVRRRELERNIKREWNRVITVLNQYACIQTGVKFSVSQQPTKGKRITLFSTKGNKTTRENIVNVFGAKTLTVLIALDLKLELEPTKAPLHLRTAGASTTDTTEIHVRGHVSRPAHGEGRQTPDRQMFFVNGRPCGLPQFAKVFNEVYKSYNASQSPFIFADIQLDTHLYDVNVSPDKRTILLHDQPRMLDNLREALIELFEAQDYAVPSSTLLLSKQMPYKKPPMTRESILSSFRNDQSQVETGQPGGSGAEDPASVDDEEEQGTTEPDGEIDTNMQTQANRAISISQWARDTAETAPHITLENEQEPSAKLLGKSQGIEARRTQTSDDDIGKHPPSLEPDSDPPDDGTENSESPTGALMQKRRESPIPAVAPPVHTAGSSASQLFAPARSKRPAPELATITIGDSTVTSMLGAPSKRTKTTPTSSSMPTRSKGKANMPSFQGRLTQMFAASTQKAQDIDESSEAPMSGQDDDVSDTESEQLFVKDDDDEIMSNSEHDADKEASADEAMMNEARMLASSAIDRGASQASSSEALAGEQSEGSDESDRGSHNEETAKIQGSDYEDEDEDLQEQEPEEQAETKSSEEAQKRTQTFMKGPIRKHATQNLQQTLRVNENAIKSMMGFSAASISKSSSLSTSKEDLPAADRLDAEDAETKLSLTISKTDLLSMKIIGQFNLGFIIAVREAKSRVKTDTSMGDRDDELFIIDQHATDEKYNFERLQASTVVQSQRLVQPKQLDLTALEEEVIKENIPALEANGFQVEIDESGFHPVGQRVRLLSLPLSRETTFDLADLEELVSLLTDHHEISASAVVTPARTTTTNTSATTSSLLSQLGSGAMPTTIPRPSKVRKMFAMRACRSSVMIGKALTTKQMEKLVRHMGELDKPWNCPHGRPTMRHLCRLGAGWDKMGWTEGRDVHNHADGDDGYLDTDGGADNGRRGGRGEARGKARSKKTTTDWAAYLRA
ncbi:uncharacterized protein B0I36DRAFT_383852 [Microdochium trichocladiopsis]|uniref:DNA mismatch repair protein MutL n=1 Tax=Microdochium trichocladiopsis TaxID=1682393 RepID=A0A9P9BQJ7_9PEZI|nr:uncharacterized protein B0I36DRAFT_383852 [Microdochium trichocladiopsis]KAH7030948.1 hypothetical protein B0I36DRAFT_383852 [Microdochium trichocladiopsis]